MSSNKNYVVVFGIYANRKNSLVKTFLIVYLLLHRGMATSWIPLITLFYSPFICVFICLMIFEYIQFFNRFIQLVSDNDITSAY